MRSHCSDTYSESFILQPTELSFTFDFEVSLACKTHSHYQHCLSLKWVRVNSFYWRGKEFGWLARLNLNVKKEFNMLQTKWQSGMHPNHSANHALPRKNWSSEIYDSNTVYSRILQSCFSFSEIPSCSLFFFVFLGRNLNVNIFHSVSFIWKVLWLHCYAVCSWNIDDYFLTSVKN